jgi:hypothetical protein
LIWFFGGALDRGLCTPGDAPTDENLQVVKIQLSLVKEHHLPALQPGADLTGAFFVIRPGGIHDPARNTLEKLRQDIDIIAHRTEAKLFWFASQAQFNPTFVPHPILSPQAHPI